MLIVTSCSSAQKEQQQEVPLVPVRVAKPTVADVPLYVEALGTLKPHAQIDVRARLEGVISKVHVQEGQWVEEADLLFELDPREYAIRIQALEATIALDRASHAVQQKKKERFQNLSDKNLISQNEWDQIETDLLRHQANIDLNLAKIEEAKLDLERCTICAIKAGRVGKVDIHPGHLVEKGTEAPLVQISCMDPLVVSFSLTEKEFGTLLPDTKAIEVHLLTAQGTKVPAELSFTDNHFDESSGQITMHARVQNPELTLRPGMAVRVKIPVEVLKGTILVSQKAVKYNQFGAYVMLVQPDNSVTLKQVQLGPDYGDTVVVTSGLTEEDVVITEGHGRAMAGAKVEVVQ